MCHSLDTSITGLNLAIQHFVWKNGVAEEKFQFCGNRTLFQWALSFLLKRLNRFKNRGKEAQLSFINFPLSWQFSKSPKAGWHKALKRRSDAARKSQFWTKILTPNIRCFVAKSALSRIMRFNCLIFLTPNIHCFVAKLSLSRILHLILFEIFV